MVRGCGALGFGLTSDAGPALSRFVVQVGQNHIETGWIKVLELVLSASGVRGRCQGASISSLESQLRAPLHPVSKRTEASKTCGVRSLGNRLATGFQSVSCTVNMTDPCQLRCN